MDEKLGDYRKKIDELDSEIIGLIERRLQLVDEVGELKKKNGLGIYDPLREQEMLEKLSKQSPKLDPEFTRKLFRLIIGYCRGEEREKSKVHESEIKSDARVEDTSRVAVLGPKGTFTESAAKRVFSDGSYVYKDNVGGVFEAVESGEVDYGVVAIENSLEGSVNNTLESLLEYDVKIVGEVTLNIRLDLLAPAGVDREEVKTILSHPHALAQCHEYLSKLDGVKLQSSDSTAAAMKEASERGDTAAIGSSDAGAMYGLEVVDSDIQDDVSQTRFIVISQEYREGSKTSIIFAVKDEPGALYKILSEFADNDINLTKIESRPSKRKIGEYLFYVDFESQSMKHRDIEGVLEKIKPKTTYLKLLGSY